MNFLVRWLAYDMKPCGLNPLANPSSQQMVCWAEADAEPVAADDAKDIRWMTLPQLRGVNVSLSVLPCIGYSDLHGLDRPDPTDGRMNVVID